MRAELLNLVTPHFYPTGYVPWRVEWMYLENGTGMQLAHSWLLNVFSTHVICDSAKQTINVPQDLYGSKEEYLS